METGAEKQTTSSRIRALHAEGHDYTEIARRLGIRYQHVHNVLGNKYVTAKDASIPPEYESADSFVDRCFTHGRSYLWPDIEAWNAVTLQDYIKAVKAQSDPGSFFDRWQEQLAGQAPDVYRLAADLLVFYYLFPDWVRKETKVENVLRTAGWGLPDDPPDRSTLESTFGKGIGGVGTHYFATQAYQILYVAQFALDAKTRRTNLSDATQVQALADEVLATWKAANEMRHALLHFLFPDLFEPIVSNRHKLMIAQAFSQYVKSDADVDTSLREIRSALTPKYGEHFSFYAPHIKGEWDTAKSTAGETDTPEDPIEVAAARKVETYGLSDLKRDTLWSDDLLNELLAALDGSLPVVLAGPPGTGKTWVAKCVVRYLTQDDSSRSRLVQFHPSFAYEQFMEGLQPVLSDGLMAFKAVPGVVVSMAQRIAPTDPIHYLIIDEMNRANLPRVLGELMYLFEYRGETIQLPYTGEFELPRNLRFIGTMNTADRSIRAIDAALRRRFEIFQCLPDAAILAYYYERHISEIPDLVQGFGALNEWLAAELGPHQTIGQTFFMTDRLTVHRLRQIWDRQIKPLLDEYFFDDPARLSDVAMERFWPSTS